ncbi:hypothetical protein GDO81_016817 [Engystomops pustulosus]|uniref:NADH dehydrogenase subunit 4L n=1 Tax=Engystomops pustulosus TaxID=76066 RepID=A0AAV7A9H1_ENGPU|nr:hypothetical protein GDO81_016817 [Engystomops pustulosus]
MLVCLIPFVPSSGPFPHSTPFSACILSYSFTFKDRFIHLLIVIFLPLLLPHSLTISTFANIINLRIVALRVDLLSTELLLAIMAIEIEGVRDNSKVLFTRWNTSLQNS